MRRLAPLAAALAIGAAVFTVWTGLPEPGIPERGLPEHGLSEHGLPEHRIGSRIRARRATPPTPPVDPPPDFGGGYSESSSEVSARDGVAHYALGAELLSSGDYYGAASHLALAREALGDYRRICEMLAIVYDQLNMPLDLAGLMDCLEREARENEAAQRLFDRLDRQLDVEVEFHAAASDHFVASFPAGGLAAGVIGDILAILEESRRRIASELGFASVRIVPVVVYQGEQFSLATDKPHWALGLYDGKIRIAIDSFGDRTELFEMALAHEYVHALTQELTGTRLPTWIREGLADNLARPMLRDRERLATEAGGIGTPLDLSELSGDFVKLGKDHAGRAYRQSFAMVHNLVREAGWEPVGDLLFALRETPDLAFGAAFEGIYGETPADYFDRWRALVEP